MKKKILLTGLLFSMMTPIQAIDCESFKSKSSDTVQTTSTVQKSAEEYFFDKAQKLLESDYENSVAAIKELSYKGFAPAQRLCQDIEAFEDAKQVINRNQQLLKALDVIEDLHNSYFAPAHKFYTQMQQMRKFWSLRSQNPDAARKILEDLAHEGYCKAQAFIWKPYFNGDVQLGIQKDQTKGKEFLEKAAAQQDPLSCLALGQLYEIGSSSLYNTNDTHVSKDLRQAVKFWRLGMGNNSFKAMFERNNIPVPSDQC